MRVHITVLDALWRHGHLGDFELAGMTWCVHKLPEGGQTIFMNAYLLNEILNLESVHALLGGSIYKILLKLQTIRIDIMTLIDIFGFE